jgi:TonB family protein
MSPQQFKAVKPDPPDLIALNSQPGGKVEPAASLGPEQKPAQQNPGEASLTAKKLEPESPKVSPPPAAEQKTKPAAAAPDPVKSEPRQKVEQKPVQKPVPPPPAALHREAPPLSAKSVPESKADKASVQAAEPAGTETPAFVPVQKEPEIVKLVQPEIPNVVWMYGAVEQVIVKVLIDADGKPIDTQILKSTKQVLEKPVIDAVLNSKFLPAQSATGPVRTWLTIPFKFKGPH